MIRILAALAAIFSRFGVAATRHITKVRVRVHVAKGRVALKLRRLAARLESRKSESTVMAEYSKIERLPDDKPPTLRKPNPNAPHAELINRVRIYAQHGAKALGPLLDRPIPRVEPLGDELDNMTEAEVAARIGRVGNMNASALCLALCDLRDAIDDEDAALDVLSGLYDDVRGVWDTEAVAAIHSAYNSPWTVKDGEVWEVET